MDNGVRKYERNAERQLEVIGQSHSEYYRRGKESEMCCRQMQSKRRRDLRRRAKRRKQIIFLTLQCLFVLIAVLLYVDIRMHMNHLQGTEQQGAILNRKAAESLTELVPEGNDVPEDDYAARCGLDYVAAPVKRGPDEVLEKLEELAEESELIKEILHNAASYPENMLEALANNPEMADFVSGYLSSDKNVTGGLSDAEKRQEYPLFLQWDPRWGYASYGDDSNIGLAGCGPTSLAMAIYYLTRDETVTPDKIAEYAMENGYYMSGTGTQWALIEEVPFLYGLKADKPGISDSLMKQELDAGNIMICTMRPGDFTAEGHFIVIYGYDDEGFLVNDPNCVARSKKSWSYQSIGGQIKQLWSLGRA